MASVGRILSAAVEVALRTPPDRVSLELVSRAAGVTPQTTYRYFADANGAVSAGLRCMILREHERMVERLAGRCFRDERELSKAVADAVLDARDRLLQSTKHVQHDILGEYRQTGFDSAPLLAEMVCQDAAASDIRQFLDVHRLAMALATTFAIVTSPISQQGPPNRGCREGTMVESVFALALSLDRAD